MAELDRQEVIVLDFFQNLDVKILDDLDEKFGFSHDYKHEFIDKMKDLVSEFKSKGYMQLTFKETVCKYCFAGYKAFEFFDLDTGDFVARYIIHKDDDCSLMISGCSNEYNKGREEFFDFLKKS